MTHLAQHSAHLAPRAGRGPHGKTEIQSSARVRGPLRDSERLRIVERPPHPDLLPARGEKEREAVRLRLKADAPGEAHLAPLAGRGQHGKAEIQDSARVRGPLRDSERLRIVERPPHPDLLPARGEKE